MKLLKTLLLTTTAVVLAGSALATKNFEGAYVGAQLGTAKTGGAKSSTETDTQGGFVFSHEGKYAKSNRWAMTGGLLGGYRVAVAQDILLGGSLGVDFNNTNFKNSYHKADNNRSATSVKQKYVVSLLGQAGYIVHKDTMAYVLLGVSYAKFKFGLTGKNPTDGSDTKTKGKFGVTTGLGVAHAVNQTVSVNCQYALTRYGQAKATSKQFKTLKNSVTAKAPKVYHAVTVGVSVKI